MSIAISGEQRDLLYELVINRISGIDDVRLAINEGAWEDAQRLSQEFSDLLRLVSEDLGWGDMAEVATVELTTPADVLERAIRVIRRETIEESPDEREKRLEVAAAELVQLGAVGACDRILRHLRADADLPDDRQD
jgi:hypothetical protein